MFTTVYNWIYFDRQPSQEEIGIISKLHIDLDTPPELSLMETLHSLLLIGKYERTGYSWKTVGFQKDDPLSDVRGGGSLCISNLIYFLKEFSLDALTMCRSRANRENGSNYPWAAASISVTRLVASIFHIIDEKSGKRCPVNEMPVLPYYHLLLECNGFNKLYVMVFILLDHQFTVTNGSYMTFPNVLIQTKCIFTNILLSSRCISDCANEVKAIVDKKYHTVLECI